MLHIPSVEEWWRLTDKYPQFRQPSNLTLKEYGYMRLFELIEEHRPKRVLEYGHGFSPTLFEYCRKHGIEIWGVDDHMDLPYFPPKDVWYENHRRILRDQFPEAKFILGQLGTRQDTIGELPKSYFDLVCSVSVLEEIGDEGIITLIFKHAGALLKPGGLLANTHDIMFEVPRRSRLLVNCLRAAGFDVELTDREAEILNGSSRYVPWNKALLENPTQAMLCYSVGELDRVFSGHWSTLFSSVRIPQGPAQLDRRYDLDDEIGALQSPIVRETADCDESGRKALESPTVASLSAELARRDGELEELRRQLTTTRAYIGVLG
jgi:hypothetical protein